MLYSLLNHIGLFIRKYVISTCKSRKLIITDIYNMYLYKINVIKVATIWIMRTLCYITSPSMHDFSASPTHKVELLQEYILISTTLLCEFVISPKLNIHRSHLTLLHLITLTLLDEVQTLRRTLLRNFLCPLLLHSLGTSQIFSIYGFIEKYEISFLTTQHN
jgi:hypothetical protein